MRQPDIPFLVSRYLPSLLPTAESIPPVLNWPHFPANVSAWLINAPLMVDRHWTLSFAVVGVAATAH